MQVCATLHCTMWILTCHEVSPSSSFSLCHTFHLGAIEFSVFGCECCFSEEAIFKNLELSVAPFLRREKVADAYVPSLFPRKVKLTTESVAPTCQ